MSDMSRNSQFFTLMLDSLAMLRGLARAASRVSSLSKRIGGLSMLLAFAALALIHTPANAKLYAHNLIDDWNEFVCFNELIHRESSWRFWAKNGSHYGLGQMRSTWYRDLTPRQQIRATLKYIDARYDGQICDGALASSFKRGWY
jgi:hypothetical protein